MNVRTAYLLCATACVCSGVALWSWKNPADFHEPGTIPKGGRVPSLDLQIPQGPWGHNVVTASGTGGELRLANHPPSPAAVRPPQATGTPIKISTARPPYPAGAAGGISVARNSAGRASPPRGLPGSSPSSHSATAETPAPLAVPFSLFDPSTSAVIPAALADQMPITGQDPAPPAGLDRMTDDFLSQVAQGSQDPKDPDYQRMWEDAQMMSDIRMKAAYGDAVWLKRHQEAYRQALGNAAADQPEVP